MLDKLVDRILERLGGATRGIVEEEVRAYFSEALLGEGVAEPKKVRRGKRQKVKKRKAGKVAVKKGGKREESKVEKLVHILETGPVLKKDLMRDLNFKTDPAIHTAISTANKLLKKKGKRIAFEKGKGGKSGVYAVRDR